MENLKNKIMANISIYIAGTGELLPITNIELNTVYNTELITHMLHLLPELERNKIYRLMGTDNKIISGRDTLANLGVADGDTISVIAVNNGQVGFNNVKCEKAQLTVRITNSGELIPIYDVDFEKETNEDLIRELKDVIDSTVHLVLDKDGNPVTIPMSFAEMGYSSGDIINVHIGSFSSTEIRSNNSSALNIMAGLTLKISSTGETIPVNDLELDQVTNTELISQLVANGMVPEVPGKVYKMVGKNNQPVEETA
ncbi:MAG: hypothetical protein J6U93_06335, partial [Alistipes sp.]|nr:hypothetical protein [Alistipes sp.]